MKLVRASYNSYYRNEDGSETYTREYDVGEKSASDIEALANEYGQTDDSLTLYDDSGKMIAQAVWPQTGGGYRYRFGEGVDNPVRAFNK